MVNLNVYRPENAGLGSPFISPAFDCGAADYREEEYFISGDAARFRFKAGTGMSPDGHCSVEKAAVLPFKTRIVVRRPVDDRRFNGIVILLWNNVTAGFDNIRTHPLIYKDGYVVVAASVQRVGIEGYAGPDPKGLLAFDPERYQGLSIPTDDMSYDLFSQIGYAVGPERTGTTDPLAGLTVRHVIARGASQSADRLATYINAVAPMGHPFSGFMLDVYMGGQSPIETRGDSKPGGIDDLSALVDGTCQAGTNRLRDVGSPIFVVNTETESRSFATVRQADGARFRIWEAAGLSHAGGIKVSAAFTATDLPPNEIDIQPFRDAALHAMRRWIENDVTPPSQPLIEMEPGEAGIPPRIARDALGIARGGARLPEVAVPTAIHSGFNTPGWAFLRGSSQPLPMARLCQIYGSEEDYLRRFSDAADAAVAAGVLLDDAARALVAREKQINPFRTASSNDDPA